MLCRSGSDKRIASDSLYDDQRRFGFRVVRGGRFPAYSSRAGSLETCGFKQTFWSLLGLWPKVTRARGRGTLSHRCWKKWGQRTPPKTNGFWNSFRPITATPQKGPRRIALASIPAAASTCRGEMPYPTAVEQCTSAWYVGAAAIRGLHAIRCTTMFGNLSRAWYAAAVFSAPHPRRKS